MFLNDGRISASLLALLALLACLASDGLVANSALTLPLVVAALVSAVVARWGEGPKHCCRPSLPQASILPVFL